MDNKLKELYLLRDHIKQNNKDDDNYENQLKNIEDKIKAAEYEKNFNNLVNTCSNIERNLYTYKGPIYEFDNKIKDSDLYRTYAKSKNEAIRNITYRIKKDLHKSTDTKIRIDIKYLKTNE
jgi:predicted  nucleic acid-binding Zn-ribbon protein